jgi:hypothetical protein
MIKMSKIRDILEDIRLILLAIPLSFIVIIIGPFWMIKEQIIIENEDIIKFENYVKHIFEPSPIFTKTGYGLNVSSDPFEDENIIKLKYAEKFEYKKWLKKQNRKIYCPDCQSEYLFLYWEDNELTWMCDECETEFKAE